MMTCGILLVLALFMRFGPDIAFRRMLNTHLVERPVRFLLSRERHEFILLVIAPALFLLGGEATLLIGPELMMAYAVDVAIYIDVVVIAAASASWSRAHGVLTRWRGRFRLNRPNRRKSSAPRSKRAHRPPSAATKADNDDDGDRPFGQTWQAFARAA